MADYTMGITGTKWRIFSAAIDQFYEKGICETAIRDVARIAGVQSATVYNYFLSKDDIIDLMYQYYDYGIFVSKPDLSQMLNRIDTITVKDILDNFTANLKQEMQGVLLKITSILIANVRLDERAKQRITRYLIVHSQHYAKTIAKGLIEAGRLELPDLEAFGEAFADITFASVVRIHTDATVSLSTWYKVCTMLFCGMKT